MDAAPSSEATGRRTPEDFEACLEDDGQTLKYDSIGGRACERAV